MKNKLLAVLILSFLTIGLFTTFGLSADVPMITEEELKAMLENPDLMILDVRLSRDYMFSDLKIKGADRPLGGHFHISGYPKDKIFVLYCSSPNQETSVPIAQQFIERGFTKIYVLKGG